jgi:hypothetical protein
VEVAVAYCKGLFWYSSRGIEKNCDNLRIDGVSEKIRTGYFLNTCQKRYLLRQPH